MCDNDSVKLEPSKVLWSKGLNALFLLQSPCLTSFLSWAFFLIEMEWRMALYDEKLLKELFEKHYQVTPNYRVAMQQEYFELTGQTIPMPTLRDRVSNYRFSITKTFNERTDDIIDQPKKLYTSQELLEAMGVDPNGDLEFDRATVNRWWLDNGNILERIRNGQLKIQLVKKKFELTEELLSDLIATRVKPITVEPTIDNGMGLLEIPLFDMHFGINTYEDYKETQSQIFTWINSRDWEENLYIIGQDLFHNDDFRGRTTKGTPIEQVDIETAWEDAMKFYCPLLEHSQSKSMKTKVIFSRGNHDETLGWAFVKVLEKMYPNIEVDTKQNEHKFHIYHKNFLGYTHGDKTNDKALAQVFNSLFRLEMAQANTRTIKRGHLHTNKMIDEYGTLIIGLGTKAKEDAWHRENGFVGNRKQFEVFIYDEEKLHAHIYI